MSMTPQTKSALDQIEKQDHQDAGFLSCAGDEYQIEVGDFFWMVDINANLVKMVGLIEQDNSIQSFVIMSGANNYDHTFIRNGDEWVIKDNVYNESTQPIPMSEIMSSHPDTWEEEYEWL